MIRTVVLAVVIGFGVSGLAAAQGPPEACGPKGDLSADLSNNAAADSRCFEVRMYTARPPADGSGGIDELHQRFRDGEVAIFEKHGAEVVGVWQRLDNPNTLVWMLDTATAPTGTRCGRRSAKTRSGIRCSRSTPPRSRGSKSSG